MKKLKVKKSLKVFVPSLAIALTLSLVPATHLVNESSVLAESTSVSTTVESNVQELNTTDKVVVAADEEGAVITLTESDFKIEDGVLTELEDSVSVGSSDSVIIDLSNAENLTSIKDVYYYGMSLFSSICRQITEIRLPSTLQSIGGNAFYNCSNLTSIELPANLTRIGRMAFSTCIGLENIEIPASVTSIGDEAFSYCTSLETVTFAEGIELTSIGDSTFISCEALTSIEIPASVTSLGQGAFYGCTSLKTVIFEEGSKLESFTGYHPFNGCTNLQVFIAANAADCEKLKTGALSLYNYGELLTYIKNIVKVSVIADGGKNNVFSNGNLEGEKFKDWHFVDGAWTEDAEYVASTPVLDDYQDYTWEDSEGNQLTAEEVVAKVEEAQATKESLTIVGTKIETSPTDSTDPEEANDPNVAAIAGGVAGGVAGAAAVGGGLWWLLGKKKKKDKADEDKQ